MKHPALFLYDIRQDVTRVVTGSWDEAITLTGKHTRHNGIDATSDEYNREYSKWHQADLTTQGNLNG